MGALFLYPTIIEVMEDKMPDKAAEALARTMHKLYGSYWQIMARSFVGGVFAGLGATLGVAVVIWILSIIFTQLGVLPGIGAFFERLNAFISTPFGSR